MKRIVLVLLLFSLVVPSLASTDEEYYFRFVIREKSDLDKLTRIISIDNVVGDTVYAYANEDELRALLDLHYSIENLPHPGSVYQHEMATSFKTLLDWDKYPTYQTYIATMRQYAATYPEICKLDTFGVSVQGRQLLAMKISKNVNMEEDEPEVFYTSTMHGDETVGYVLLIRFIDYLLTQYGHETPAGRRVSKLVDNMEIWINPLSNPDGTYRLGGDTTVSNARRYNANNVDLNRNFPDRVSDSVNTTAGRQIETKYMMEFVPKRNFTLAANFHGGAQVVNYPWDNGAASGSYSTSPDDQLFIAMSRAYATPNPDMLAGGFANGITNGCKWYAIFGGRQDWMYQWYGALETTIELWNTKNPAGSVLPQRWVNNLESLLAYLEHGFKGVRGIVRDAVTLAPLKARVDFVGINGIAAFTDPDVGDYHRPLLPGTYTAIYRATGFRPDTVKNIIVADTGTTRVNVSLQPLVTSVANDPGGNPSAFTLFQNYPNPFNPTTTIRLSVDVRSCVSLRVYDLLGREVATLINGTLESGLHEVLFDASELPSGVFFYRLNAGGFMQTRKLILQK